MLLSLAKFLHVLRSRYTKPKENRIIPYVEPFSWFVEIDDSSCRYQYAIDSGMTVKESKYGMTVFQTHDKDSWVEFLNYCAANKKKIAQEFMVRYADDS